MVMLTDAQIAWAKAHDWFHHVDRDGVLHVADDTTTRDHNGIVVLHHQVIAWRGTFQDLRLWAGY